MLSAYVIVIEYGAPASTLNSQRSGAGRGPGILRDGGDGGGLGGGGGGLLGGGGGLGGTVNPTHHDKLTTLQCEQDASQSTGWLCYSQRNRLAVL